MHRREGVSAYRTQARARKTCTWSTSSSARRALRGARVCHRCGVHVGRHHGCHRRGERQKTPAAEAGHQTAWPSFRSPGRSCLDRAIALANHEVVTIMGFEDVERHKHAQLGRGARGTVEDLTQLLKGLDVRG